MIIKIHQACTTKNALFYNERKVERQKASFYHSQNMPVVNPFLGVTGNHKCSDFGN
jgi:hypothetical protein